MQLRNAISVGAVLLADDKQVGATCGGVAGNQCGAGLFCDFRDGTALAPSAVVRRIKRESATALS
jgi:hypothetical protein